MLESQTRIYQFLLGYTKQLLKDINAEDFEKQPVDGATTPRWILTHLAISTDYAARALGGERRCPKEWHVAYGPGSSPTASDAPKPTREELLTAYEQGHERVTELVRSAKSEDLLKPHNVEFLKATPMETVADFVSHLMTSHVSTHLGQLSFCRRAVGHKALF